MEEMNTRVMENEVMMSGRNGIWKSSTNTKNLSSIFSPNSMPLWSWLWMKTRNRTFSARCLWICTSTMRS